MTVNGNIRSDFTGVATTGIDGNVINRHSIVMSQEGTSGGGGQSGQGQGGQVDPSNVYGNDDGRGRTDYEHVAPYTVDKYVCMVEDISTFVDSWIILWVQPVNKDTVVDGWCGVFGRGLSGGGIGRRRCCDAR